MPGLNTQTKEVGNYRLNHPHAGDVAITTFARGIIKDFGVESDDPLTLDDTCTVAVADTEYANIPFFYHCRQGIPVAPEPPPKLPDGFEWVYDFIPSTEPDVDDGANFLLENGALKRGAWSFNIGQEVKVLLQYNVPKYVVGHIDRPQKCHNIFQVDTYDWAGTAVRGGQPEKGNASKQGFICSTPKTYGNYNENPLSDQYDKNLTLNLSQNAYRLFGYKEFQRGTTILFYGDWLIRIGPVMYIFQVASIGLPGPTTRDIKILAALYSPELEAKAIAAGRTKETLYPPVLGGGVPYAGPFLFEDISYEGFVKQSSFSNYILGYYVGQFGSFGGSDPRWVYTEIFTEPVEV